MSVHGEKYIGSLTAYQHDIAGQVFAIDERTLRIEGFTYDGEAPDAFIFAGIQGNRPESLDSAGIILPVPFDGKYYAYDDYTAPILDRKFEGVSIGMPCHFECSQKPFTGKHHTPSPVKLETL